MAASGWSEENNALSKEFSFSSYEEAVSFANKAAELAEKLDHHPDILLQYGKVTITLTTHSAGNIVTEKDYEYAKLIDS